jgi:hypothetical protein
MGTSVKMIERHYGSLTRGHRVLAGRLGAWEGQRQQGEKVM